MQYTLSETLNHILRLCQPLSSETANHRRADGEWTISEIVEHLAIVERAALVGLKRSLSQAPADTEKILATTGKSDLIATRVATAINRIQALEITQPTGKFGPWPAPLEALIDTRQNFIDLETGDSSRFDTHIMEHPILGPMTVRQWFQFIAAHTNRHQLQIESLLAAG